MVFHIFYYISYPIKNMVVTRTKTLTFPPGESLGDWITSNTVVPFLHLWVPQLFFVVEAVVGYRSYHFHFSVHRIRSLPFPILHSSLFRRAFFTRVYSGLLHRLSSVHPVCTRPYPFPVRVSSYPFQPQQIYSVSPTFSPPPGVSGSPRLRELSVVPKIWNRIPVSAPHWCPFRASLVRKFFGGTEDTPFRVSADPPYDPNTRTPTPDSSSPT